ncbi:mediator of RNA polymerase II transcription subunit 11-like isoform X1 [Musa acuminata AAA Group]|uniref:mediator of RNA polymerase II transcription subunit 11 isoform X1 n=1 Tax=Musa acuminata AAA Group TaxID=214697 RepID=UPI0031D722F5
MDPQQTSLQRLHNVEKVGFDPFLLPSPSSHRIRSFGDAALTFSFSLCRCCFRFLFILGAGLDWRRHQRIVRVLELAGSVMDELASSTGPRADVLAVHCREFMQSIKEIQTTLREEIKSACEYRPFEKCDYSARISNEICSKKLEYIIEQLDDIKESIN